MKLPPINVWLSAGDAARKLGVHPDTIARRGIPYTQDQGFVPHKLRYKLLILDEGKDGERRYLEADLEAMLHDPPPRATGPMLVPRFTA